MDKRVGFGPRLGAVLMDGIVVWLLSFFLGGTLGAMLGLGAGAIAGAGDQAEGAAAAGALIGGMLGMMAGFYVFGLLYSLIEAFTGASPGKMILKLKVGTAEGRQAPIQTYLTRWAVKNAGTLLGVLALVPGLGILSTLSSIAGLVIFVGCFLVLGQNRQALHDMAAKTAIFKTTDLS